MAMVRLLLVYTTGLELTTILHFKTPATLNIQHAPQPERSSWNILQSSKLEILWIFTTSEWSQIFRIISGIRPHICPSIPPSRLLPRLDTCCLAAEQLRYLQVHTFF